MRNSANQNTGEKVMKRTVDVFRRGKGFVIIDKGNIIFKTEDQSRESRFRVRDFLIRNNIEADKCHVNRFSWLGIGLEGIGLDY